MRGGENYIHGYLCLEKWVRRICRSCKEINSGEVVSKTDSSHRFHLQYNKIGHLCSSISSHLKTGSRFSLSLDEYTHH